MTCAPWVDLLAAIGAACIFASGLLIVWTAVSELRWQRRRARSKHARPGTVEVRPGTAGTARKREPWGF